MILDHLSQEFEPGWRYTEADVNEILAGYHEDVAALRVAIEADGRRWHSDSRSLEHDRVRQNCLTAAGWRILRVTDRQIRDDPAGMCRHLNELVGMEPGNRR